MGVRTTPDSLRGQATLELMVGFPVVLIVAIIATNALLFFSDCAAFDRAFREAVRVHAASPAYGQGVDEGCGLVAATLDPLFNRDNENVSIVVERLASGHARFTGTLDFVPTLFGLGMRSSVFGVELPALTHTKEIVVEVYRPGVLL